MTAAAFDRDYAKCCFGRMDVCTATRIIATFSIGLMVVSTFSVTGCIIIEISNLCQIRHTHQNSHMNMLNLTSLSSTLFIGMVNLYFNFYLQKATHEKNLQNIRHWLALSIMNTMYIGIYFGCMALIYRSRDFLIMGIIIGIVIIYFRCVVRTFYRNELTKSSAIRNVFLPNQPILSGIQLPAVDAAI